MTCNLATVLYVALRGKNHGTRWKSRKKPSWWWICDYLTAL